MTAPKKRISEMSDDEKRIAIAVASGKWEICSFCGRNFITPKGFRENQGWDDHVEGGAVDYLWPTFGKTYEHLMPPEYLSDLNALQRAVSAQSQDTKSDFDDEMHEAARINRCYIHELTSDIWADSLLLTLGHEN